MPWPWVSVGVSVVCPRAFAVLGVRVVVVVLSPVMVWRFVPPSMCRLDTFRQWFAGSWFDASLSPSGGLVLHQPSTGRSG